MSRMSAGELEGLYKTKHELYDFFDEMQSKVFRKFGEKGRTWKNCDIQYLIDELIKHVKKEDWVDVANFCFMLRDRQINVTKEKKQ